MNHSTPCPTFSDAITVGAWIESESYQAEGLQSVVSKWRIGTSFNQFDAYDASATDDLDTRGFFGAVFDGRYVYFVPQSCGGSPPGQHGRVLRYDTLGEFASSSSWSAYDASETNGLRTRGYYGAVFDGRYINFIPRTDGVDLHTRMLRYDTQGEFKSPISWEAHDAGHGMSCQGAGFDGRYIYYCPGYAEVRTSDDCGFMLRFDTQGALDDPGSYHLYDAGSTGGLKVGCFDGAVFDGRFIYFVPLGVAGGMLRFDTQGDFNDGECWQAFDAGEISGLRMGSCVGATFDGRFVYYVPYAGSVAVRFDTRGNFTDPVAWSAHDVAGTGGLRTCGYDGAVFDGRFVYYIPFWAGGDTRQGFHGEVLRYDTQKQFSDGDGWQAVDAGRTAGLASVGFNGGAFDGRFIYMAPWRRGTDDENNPMAHGNVLRYDTVGRNATFSLRAADFGHNGGLCGAVPGPSFLVNTEKGVVSVRANRVLSPGRHHLAGVYDGSTVRLFIDGEAVAEQQGSGRIQNCHANIITGELEGGTGRFPGSIDDVRVDDVARDAGAIADQIKGLI